MKPWPIALGRTPAPSSPGVPRLGSGSPLIALGVGSGGVSLLGPLVGGVIEYHASDGAINQIIGGDVAALVLVAPVSILAGILILRRHSNGALLGLGPAIYAPYMYTQLALGNDPGRYAGNSEQFFLLYLEHVVLGLVILTRTWRLLHRPPVTEVSRGSDRGLAIFLLTVAGFLTFGLHLPGIVDAMTNAPSMPNTWPTPLCSGW